MRPYKKYLLEREKAGMADSGHVILPEIKRRGIIVNCQSMVNYDMCINFTEEERKTYQSCVYSKIKYHVLNPVTLEPGETVEEPAYRVRLKNVSVSLDAAQNSKKKKVIDVAIIRIKRLIMYSNGLVNCLVSDIDEFNRILVIIEDSVTKRSYNDVLLEDFRLIATPYQEVKEKKEKKAQRKAQRVAFEAKQNEMSSCDRWMPKSREKEISYYKK